MTEGEIRAEIKRRGLRLERRGTVWRVTGPGVDVSVAHLGALHLLDLEPIRHTAKRERTRREGGDG